MTPSTQSNIFPRDGISLTQAKQRFGIGHARLSAMIAGGELRTWPAPEGTPGQPPGVPHIVLSLHDCERLLPARPRRSATSPGAPPPDDGVPLADLEKDLGMSRVKLRDWCEWDPHPALGRKVRSGRGSFDVERPNGVARVLGLLVSRADMVECAEAAQRPLYRRFPGNPGVWIADGIFQHDEGGRLFFSVKHLESHASRFRLPVTALWSSQYKEKLESQAFTWPTRGRLRWKVTAFSADSVSKLVGWREGKADGGRWLVPGMLWQDPEGIWYSTAFVGQETAPSGATEKHRRLCASRLHHWYGVLTRRKEVPAASKRGGRSIIVYHESEVRPLLGIPAPTETPAYKEVGGHPKETPFLTVGSRQLEAATYDRGTHDRLDKLIEVVQAGRTTDRSSEDEEPERPERPTRAWCLLAPKTVRWGVDGKEPLETDVPPRIFHLLAAILDQPKDSIPFDAFDHLYRDKPDPDGRLRDDVSALSSQLRLIAWPYQYKTRGSHVVVKPAER